MERDDDESSESDAESFFRKKDSPVKNKVENRTEEKSSRGHGVVDVSSPRRKKSTLLKQSVSPKSLGKTNEQIGRLHSSDTRQAKIENSRTAKHVNIKEEEFSSDAEREDSIRRSHEAAQAKKNLFQGWKPKTVVPSNRGENNSNEPDLDNDADERSETIDQRGDDQSRNHTEKFRGRREHVVKKEAIPSNDQEDANKDSETTNNQNEREISPKFEASDRSLDGDIPLSQFWMSQRIDNKDDDKDGKLVKISQKLSPAKNSTTGKSNGKTEENSSDNLDFEDEELLERKSPLPRITKDEIIGEKYERTEQPAVKSKNEFSSDDERPMNGTEDISNKGKLERKTSFSEGFSDGESESQTKRSPKKLKQSPKKMLSPSEESQKNRSPSKKKQSPKKTRSPVKTKQQISKAEESDDNLEVEAAEKGNKKKTAIKRTLKSLLNDDFAITRPGICDDDTSSEEEKKHFVRKKVSKNVVLGLEKPGNRSKTSSNSNSTQMVLVMKSHDQPLDDNPSIKSRSTASKSLISRNKDNMSSSEDDSSDSAPPGKESQPINGSLNQKELESRSGSELASASALASSTKIIDSEDNLEKEKTGTAKKIPLKRKYLESQSDEKESNKRAKLLVPVSQTNAHELSDSDDTDSLTKLNTTLNKSMALMENDMETTKSNKSRKSVSINTKHKSKTVTNAQNNSKTQKSILKKTEYVSAADEEENVSQFKEDENIQQNIQSINVKPKIIHRPMNFKDLEQQDNLIHDTSTKPSFVLQDLSSEDEIYIMDIPRTIDPRELKGLMIRLAGKNKLEIGNEFYETCEKDAPNISCIFRTDRDNFSCETVNIKPAACINVRQKLSKCVNVELPPSEKLTVPFPKNLKTRHPLFGANYGDKIAIEEKKLVKNIATKSEVRGKSIPKLNETSLNDAAEEYVEIKAEKKLTKTKRPKKLKVEEVDFPLVEPDESVIECKTDGEKPAQSFSNYSSDSDSYEGFFQTVKRGKMKKHKKVKDDSNLSRISNIEKTVSPRDLPVHAEDSTEDSQQEDLSAIKESDSSFNEPAMKLKRLRKTLKPDKFSSSTPNKFDKDWINDDKISSNIFGKRKKDRIKKEGELYR